MFSYVGCTQILFPSSSSFLVRFSNAADIQIKICNTFKIDKYKILNSARANEPWNLIY